MKPSADLKLKKALGFHEPAYSGMLDASLFGDWNEAENCARTILDASVSLPPKSDPVAALKLICEGFDHGGVRRFFNEVAPVPTSLRRVKFTKERVVKMRENIQRDVVNSMVPLIFALRIRHVLRSVDRTYAWPLGVKPDDLMRAAARIIAGRRLWTDFVEIQATRVLCSTEAKPKSAQPKITRPFATIWPAEFANDAEAPLEDVRRALKDHVPKATRSRWIKAALSKDGNSVVKSRLQEAAKGDFY